MKTIIGKDLKSSLNTTFTINNRIVTDSREIANRFNNYFISIGPLLASDITCSVNPLSYVKSIHNSMNIIHEHGIIVNVLLRSRTSHILTQEFKCMVG